MVHEDYLRELDRRLRTELGAWLIGTYLIGSAARGEYVEGESDLDVAAVCSSPPSAEALESVARVADHSELPCPALKLELVVYSRESLDRRPVEFELNLNTGAGIETDASTDPATEPSHWFTLDVVHARDSALALTGPPPEEVFPVVAPDDLRQALTESLDWYRSHGSPEEFARASERSADWLRRLD